MELLKYIILCYLALLGDTFYGSINIKHQRQDTIEMREAYSFLNSDVPFDSILISFEKITICGDTLISIHSDVNGKSFSTYVQLQDLFFARRKDGTYKQIYTELGISKIKKFDKGKTKKIILGFDTQEFKSMNNIGDTEYTFNISQIFNFSEQVKNKYIFSKVFCDEGLILQFEENYLPRNIFKKSTVNSITMEKYNCKVQLDQVNFGK